jgi:hypothetical protein
VRNRYDKDILWLWSWLWLTGADALSYSHDRNLKRDRFTHPKKTRRKARILEKLRCGSTTNDLAGSDKQALHSNPKMRNTVHVQQGNKGTLFTRVMIVSG